MAVKKVPQVYKASDDREFDNQADAEKHEAFLTAETEFLRARELWRHAVIENYKTADGVTFDFGLFKDYWYLVEWSGLPSLHKVSFMSYQQKFAIESSDESTTLKLVHNMNGRESEFDVSELYYHESNAKKALRVAMESRKAMLQKQIDQLAAAT